MSRDVPPLLPTVLTRNSSTPNYNPYKGLLVSILEGEHPNSSANTLKTSPLQSSFSLKLVLVFFWGGERKRYKTPNLQPYLHYNTYPIFRPKARWT